MQRVYDYLKKVNPFYVATVEGDQPRVRPIGAVDLFEDKIYFLTGKVKPMSKQMQSNPKIEICSTDGQTCLRIQAIAVNDERLEPKQHMLAAYPEVQGMYKADDGNTQVLYLKDAVATISTFTDEPIVIRF